MSLCIHKNDLTIENSKISVDLKKEETEVKKPVDSFCETDKECITGFCGPTENCHILFKNSSMCEKLKVCKTSDNISQTTNFNLKHN